MHYHTHQQKNREGFTSGVAQTHTEAAAAASSGSKTAWFTRQRDGFTAGVRKHTTNSAAGGQHLRKQTHPVAAGLGFTAPNEKQRESSFSSSAGAGKSRRGFTLIETLVGITVLLLAIVGPMTIAARGLQTAFYAKEQITAYYLAQEAVEFVRAVRDENALNRRDWLTGIPAYCDPDNNSGGCSVNVRAIDVNGIQNGFVNCSSSANACRVYYDDGEMYGNRGFYVHTSTGNIQTPFTRQVYVNETVSGREAEVRVEVSWQAGVFGGTRTVTVQSRLFNHYDNL